MGDERLRELERRFVATGAAEDGAAWLLERVRAGDLTRTRLEVAALCGHAGALLATGREPPPDFARDLKDDTTQRGDPMWWGASDWARALWAVDRTVAVRAGWLAASATLHHWREANPGQGQPGATLDAVAVWLTEPTERRAFTATVMGLGGEGAVEQAARGRSRLPSDAAGLAAAYCGFCAGEAADLPREEFSSMFLHRTPVLVWLLDAVADAEGTPARVLPLVQQRLLTWTLDPR